MQRIDNENISYIVFYNEKAEFSANIVARCAFKYNSLIYNKEALKTEFDADEYALEGLHRNCSCFLGEIDKGYEKYAWSPSDEASPDDLGENAYWIMKMKGSISEINQLILKRSDDIYDKIECIINSGRTQLLKKDEFGNVIIINNPDLVKPLGKPRTPYEYRNRHQLHKFLNNTNSQATVGEEQNNSTYDNKFNI